MLPPSREERQQPESVAKLIKKGLKTNNFVIGITHAILVLDRIPASNCNSDHSLFLMLADSDYFS